MKRQLFVATTLLFISILTMGQGDSDGKATITLEDLASVPGAGTHVLSPDGKRFATIEDGQIALVAAEGGWPVILTTTAGAKSEVSWSPDGTQLAYVSLGGIWAVDVGGGQPRRLTDGPPGPGDPRGATDHIPKWSPTGTWILFQSGRRGRNELYVVSEDGRAKNFLAAAETYAGLDQLDQTTGDGDGVAGDRFDPGPAWSPDGTSISYTERSREFFSGKVMLLNFDPATGRVKGAPVELYTATTDRGGAWAIDRVSWSPDGQTLAFILQSSGWDKVYLLSSHGGQPRQLTQGESEDYTPEFSPDGKFVAIVSNRNHPEERHVWIVPVDGGAPHPLAELGPGVEGNPRWSPDGKKIYFVRSTPFESPDLYVATTTGNASAHALTHTLPLSFAAAAFHAPEVVHFKGKDGLDLSGILYRPAGYIAGTHYPAVVWVHGGPEGQDTLGFSPWSLFLAQQGYLVFQPNYRGSTGYGERFRNLNVEDSGGGEVQDLDSAVQYLISQGLADAKRIAIGGGSHGGTEVNYAVTKLPDTFAAAISLFGVSDRATFLDRTNRNSAIRWETKMGGSPAEKPAVYRQANILLDVAKIKTPLLIMHGEEDPQVPPYESAQLVNALKKNGKNYLYFTYPHEGHGFQNREHKLDAWSKQELFLRKYLQPSYGHSITSVDDAALFERPVKLTIQGETK
jgi:dipeptidyl aminopeptidase/acylaminoacyl peptidase